MDKLEPAQIRAARGLLGISQSELAATAGVSLITVKRAEAGEATREGTGAAIRQALERKGVEFIEENGGGAGVRLRKKRKK